MAASLTDLTGQLIKGAMMHVRLRIDQRNMSPMRLIAARSMQ
jgi:hypothetical protein